MEVQRESQGGGPGSRGEYAKLSLDVHRLMVPLSAFFCQAAGACGRILERECQGDATLGPVGIDRTSFVSKVPPI